MITAVAGMKKSLIALGGAGLLLVGAVMVVLPGPGLPIVVAGLALLATEFAWARNAMRRIRRWAARGRRRTGLLNWLRSRRRGRLGAEA
jgi:hypothetical protein